MKVVVQFDSLSFWERVGVRGLSANCNHNLTAGFSPQSVQVWANVRRSIEDFMHNLFRAGALMGITAEEAYFVKCDRTTMTQNDIDNGRLTALVGFAPLKPAEFVILTFHTSTRHS